MRNTYGNTNRHGYTDSNWYGNGDTDGNSNRFTDTDYSVQFANLYRG